MSKPLTELQINEIIEDFEIEVNNEMINKDVIKKGTEYSPKMLDINELTNSIYGETIPEGTPIDLKNYPEITGIQVGSQVQLEMLTLDSREQIEFIHFSNDISCGQDEEIQTEDDINLRNIPEPRLDETLDLKSFENVKSIEFHFYWNPNLEKISLPESAKAIKIQNSQIDSFKTKENFNKETSLIVSNAYTKDTDVDFEDLNEKDAKNKERQEAIDRGEEVESLKERKTSPSYEYTPEGKIEAAKEKLRERQGKQFYSEGQSGVVETDKKAKITIEQMAQKSGKGPRG